MGTKQIRNFLFLTGQVRPRGEMFCFVYYLFHIRNPDHSGESEWAPCNILNQILKAILRLFYITLHPKFHILNLSQTRKPF